MTSTFFYIDPYPWPYNWPNMKTSSSAVQKIILRWKLHSDKEKAEGAYKILLKQAEEKYFPYSKVLNSQYSNFKNETTVVVSKIYPWKGPQSPPHLWAEQEWLEILHLVLVYHHPKSPAWCISDSLPWQIWSPTKNYRQNSLYYQHLIKFLKKLNWNINFESNFDQKVKSNCKNRSMC